MSSFGLVVATALSGAVVLSTVAWIRPHLAASLAELCGARHRGDFWTVVCLAALLVGPTICALVTLPLWRLEGVHGGMAVLQGALGGLLMGLTVTAVVVLAFTARMARWTAAPSPQSR